MNDLFPVTTDEEIAELKREIAMREDVYPRWVAAGKLKQEVADRRIAVMKAILQRYGA